MNDRIKVGIVGYGNLGKGVELALAQRTLNYRPSLQGGIPVKLRLLQRWFTFQS